MDTDARSRRLAWLRPLFEGLGGEPLAVIVGSSAVLVIAHSQGSTGFFRSTFGASVETSPWASTLPYFWWFLSSVVFYLVLPLIIALVTRGQFHQRYGLQLGDWRFGLSVSALFVAVMVPAVWWAATLDSFRGIYPLAGNAAFLKTIGPGKTELSWSLFIAYEASYFAYFIAWEFLFRGWMIHGLLPKWGRGPAILVQVVPFAAMHLGKAELEALGSIIAAIALGILAVRARSFLYGALIHGTVALWMDFVSARTSLFTP